MKEHKKEKSAKKPKKEMDKIGTNREEEKMARKGNKKGNSLR